MKLHNLFVLMLAAVLFACGGKGESTEGTGEGQEVVEEPKSALTDGAYRLADANMLTWEGSKAAYGHTGTIAVSEGSFEVANGTISSGSFTIDMSTMTNTDIEADEDKAKLIGHLSSDDFFGVETYPTSTFVVKSVAASDAEGATHTITGDLTIKDKTNEISFPATISQEGDMITTTASFTIDRAKWDVKFNSPDFPDFANLAADKIISNDIKIEFSLVANKAGEGM